MLKAAHKNDLIRKTQVYGCTDGNVQTIRAFLFINRRWTIEQLLGSSVQRFVSDDGHGAMIICFSICGRYFIQGSFHQARQFIKLFICEFYEVCVNWISYYDTTSAHPELSVSQF